MKFNRWNQTKYIIYIILWSCEFRIDWNCSLYVRSANVNNEKWGSPFSNISLWKIYIQTTTEVVMHPNFRKNIKIDIKLPLLHYFGENIPSNNQNIMYRARCQLTRAVNSQPGHVPREMPTSWHRSRITLSEHRRSVHESLLFKGKIPFCASHSSCGRQPVL